MLRRGVACAQILIANNGIGAVKAIRSMRRWSYETFGSEQAFQFLVMATPDDIVIGAEYIKLADEVRLELSALNVPPGTSNWQALTCLPACCGDSLSRWPAAPTTRTMPTST